jgi:VWFA-related protein
MPTDIAANRPSRRRSSIGGAAHWVVAMGLPSRSSCLFVVPLLFLSLGSGPARPAARSLQSSATFRSRTDLVALDVSVEGPSGEPVRPLDASQFVVLEDDVPQDITFFAPEGRLPLAVVLLVDHSQSMAGERLARAKTATSAFLRTLEPDDRVEILAFDEAVTRLYPLGEDHAAADQSIRDLSAGRSTALYDALLVGLRDLEQDARSRAGDCQHAIVVLSDGDDTKSRETFEDVSDDARRSSVAIDTISLRSDDHNRSLPPAHELIQLAIDTGGEAIAVRRVSDLASVYEQISSALRQRYRLGYVSSSAVQDGRWHRISIRIPEMNVIARTRTGYYAPTARAPAGLR